MTRRTITIDDDNERNLNQLRGWLLTERNKDLDYTSTVNMVLALGFNIIGERKFTDNQIKISNNYIHHNPLKPAALDDEHWDYWLKNVYPSVAKKLERLEKKKSHSVKRKKKDDGNSTEGREVV